MKNESATLDVLNQLTASTASDADDEAAEITFDIGTTADHHHPNI